MNRDQKKTKFHLETNNREAFFSKWRLIVIEIAGSHFCLEIVSETVEGLQHKVDVDLLHRLVGDDAAEEVGELAERLVADHDGALGHHLGLDFGRHLEVKVDWKVLLKLSLETWKV